MGMVGVERADCLLVAMTLAPKLLLHRAAVFQTQQGLALVVTEQQIQAVVERVEVTIQATQFPMAVMVGQAMQELLTGHKEINKWNI
jgi:hypothetical protein